MKKIFILSALWAVSFSLSASYTGRVFVDKNNDGIWNKGEETLKGIKVSDGLNVTETAPDGTYTLPGYEREKFIFITTPSGYKTINRHYHRIENKEKEYDFALLPYNPGIRKDGSHRFIHISDTEIFNTAQHEDWVGNVRDYAANEQVAFIIHTGDICYEKGMKEHIHLMNTGNMKVPVFYCIGNHDLERGKYGEEIFESIYGPVYYSFDVAGTHYIVTPMPGGDARPEYTTEDVCNWLKNDLAHLKPGTPIMVFNHDLLTNSDTFIYKGKDGNSIHLNDYNLKAWIYGHWHINYMKRQGDVYTICTSSLDKGGIDHAKSAYRVITVGPEGNLSSELRYTYLDRNLRIASPQGRTATKTVTVNTYSSTSPVAEVTYTCLENGKTIIPYQKLSRKTDWSWTAVMPLNDLYAGKELVMRVRAHFKDGRTAEADSKFIYEKDCPKVTLGTDWKNLLGNATHTATANPLEGEKQLAWVTNVGANLYMTSPLIYNNKVYIASIDEDLKGQAHIYALDGKDGSLLWKYPVKSSIKNTIAIESGIVFAQDVQGNLYAVDAETGKLRWESQLPVNGLPNLIDGLAADKSIVYAGSGKALSAFEAATGKLIWRNKDWSQGEGTTSTLTVGNGILIGSAQWGALYGNDAKTGKMLWKISDFGLRNRGASAAMHGSLLYIISEKSFFILEAQTGRIIVRKQLPYNLHATSTPLLTEKEIIFGTADKGLVALDNQTLEEKWNCQVEDALIFTVPYTRSFSGTIETSPVLAGKTVYVGASDGTIYAIDTNTGNKLWKYKTGAPIFGTAAISGDALIVADFGGNVYTFRCVKPIP